VWVAFLREPRVTLIEYHGLSAIGGMLLVCQFRKQSNSLPYCLPPFPRPHSEGCGFHSRHHSWQHLCQCFKL